MRLGILATTLCVYACVVENIMFPCKSGHFRKYPLCLLFCCNKEYVHILDWKFLATRLCVYVCVLVEGIYTCRAGHIGNKPLC